MLIAIACPVSCVRRAAPLPQTGEDAEVTVRGSVEVTARLEEIPEGAIFERDLYNYATILKCQVVAVHRGQIAPTTLYVAHYNPFKSRADAADRRVAGIGGDLRMFRGGQVHRLALEVPLDDYYMGAIVNKYFGQDVEPIYWAVWTNVVSD